MVDQGPWKLILRDIRRENCPDREEQKQSSVESTRKKNTKWKLAIKLLTIVPLMAVISSPRAVRGRCPSWLLGKNRWKSLDRRRTAARRIAEPTRIFWKHTLLSSPPLPSPLIRSASVQAVLSFLFFTPLPQFLCTYKLCFQLSTATTFSSLLPFSLLCLLLSSDPTPHLSHLPDEALLSSIWRVPAWRFENFSPIQTFSLPLATLPPISPLILISSPPFSIPHFSNSNQNSPLLQNTHRHHARDFRVPG